MARGSCVLFLGADYPLADNSAPTRGQLAVALAKQYRLPHHPSLADTVDEFLTQQPRNRNGLISFLKTQLELASSHQPTEAHCAIAALGFNAVVTAWYDDLLEQAYRAAGKSIVTVVHSLDVAYASHGEDVIIVKLYGSIEQPDSLVVTGRDMIRIQGHLTQRLEDVRP